MTNSNFIIDHQCPQCGAPAVLEETDHLYSCEFCKVKSYLLSSVYRYVLPHNAPEGTPVFYYPYWRFKGMLFSAVSREVSHKIVDMSHQAINSNAFPVSVGLRSQTQKLRFMTSEIEGNFLKPHIPLKDATINMEALLSSTLPKPLYSQAFIGESISILYSPFYLKNKIYDGILNRPITENIPDDFNIEEMPGGSSDWQIQFITAQCPECGWDLDGSRDSLALTCTNCSSIWQSGKSKFMKLKYGFFGGNGKDDFYLPFWRIKAEVSGIDLQSYADLVKVANLPKVVQEEWKEQEFRFWSPAFKVRPQNFINLSRNLTLSQPKEKLIPELPKGTVQPVTLSIMEAVEGLKINLATYIKPHNTMYPKLEGIEIKPKSFVLVFIPFHEKGTDITHPEYKLRINRNILKYAKHL